MKNHLSNNDSIPVGRVIEKLDVFLNKKDYLSAEKHLKFWRSEADTCHDLNGKLIVLNEQIGLYRKTNNESGCLEVISEALSLADSLNSPNSIIYGTTLLNAATGYKAFGKPDEAIILYRKAKMSYDNSLESSDRRFAGLYNNMALVLVELKEFEEAKQLYNQAMEIMSNQENGELDVAITLLNYADLIVAEKGIELGEKEIERYLIKAEELIDKESLPRNGYYAFVCEKCAPVFGYYGHFAFEQELKRRAKNYYERA